jgi:hypothetical protein
MAVTETAVHDAQRQVIDPESPLPYRSALYMQIGVLHCAETSFVPAVIRS